jgi:phosphoglycerate dehydrogenase-like enzyme
MGAIGAEVARLASAFGMRVLATRRSVTEPRTEDGVTLLPSAQLAQLLAESDYVVLAVPLTPETSPLIGARELALLKPEAVVINIARGNVIDETALVEALRDGRIRGAALDVFAKEPLPADSPLWDMENVLISPHLSGSTPYYDERAVEIFCDNLRRFLAGEPLRNQVDPGRGY